MQILNLENFQITMFSVIRATNYASSMFWLAWIIMGKFILLTLFLAVTLDAFERKYEVRCGVEERVLERAHLQGLSLQRAYSVSVAAAVGSPLVSVQVAAHHFVCLSPPHNVCVLRCCCSLRTSLLYSLT